jgi:hypothetical protein
VVYGSVLILIVAFAPRGIAGVLGNVRARVAQFRSSQLQRAHG